MPSSVSRRIGVLTFHRCINYGSYWQARCLVEGLRAAGHQAVLLDHDSQRVNNAEWRCAFQPKLPERTPRSDYGLYAAKARALLSAIDRLPLSARFQLDAPQTMPEQEVALVGSDEVWNLSHPWYGGGRAPIFYGAGLNANRLVAYAASFGNHHASDGLDPWWAGRLRVFSAISVRDENSRKLVQGAVGRDPAVVLDPCLQFPPPPVEEAGDERPPYIALYGHSFPAWFVRAVRRFATWRGLKLLSIGYRNEWADEQHIAAGPEEFASLIARSAAVVTNFFHGCVFALLNTRPFVCATSPYRFNKVRDLARTVGSEKRLVEESTTDDRYAKLLGEPLEPSVGVRIAALRDQSRRYLQHALA